MSNDMTFANQFAQATDSERQLLARIAGQSPRLWSGVALALANRSTTTLSPQIDTGGASKIIMWLRLVNFGGGSGIKPYIRFTDGRSGTFRDLATGVANITSVGPHGYCLGPVGTPTTTGGDFLAYASVRVCNCILPRLIQLGVSHSDALIHEYELSYQLLP